MRIRRTTLFLAIVTVLAAGCADQSPAEPDGTEKMAAVHAIAGMGRLIEADAATPEPGAISSISQPTGKWWNAQGLSYAIAAGAHVPGEEVSVFVRVEEPDKAAQLPGRKLRYRLIELTSAGEPAFVVNEQTATVTTLDEIPAFSLKLPDAEGKRYALSAEILAGDEVEDAVISTIEVPMQQVDAALQLDREVYATTGPVTLTVMNHDGAELSFGLEYSFERRSGDGWEPVRLQGTVAIPAIGYHVGKGGRWEQKIQLTDCPTGTYRIGKEVEGAGTRIKKTLYAEFRVE
jgi:hypothetical protein